MANNQQPIDLSFPVKGLDENWAYKVQPEGTSPDCLNVRPYDQIAKRLRGGQRPGLSKYFAAAVNGTEPIQRLGVSIQAVVSGKQTFAETFDFVPDTAPLKDTNWLRLKKETHPAWTASTTYPWVEVDTILHNDATANGVGYAVGALYKLSTFVSTAYTLQAQVYMAKGVAAPIGAGAGFLVRGNTLTPPFDDAVKVHSCFFHIGATNYTISIAGHTTIAALSASDPTHPWRNATWWGTPRTLKLVVSGNTFNLYADGYLLNYVAGDIVEAGLAGNPYVGLYLTKGSGAGNTVDYDTWSYAATAPISGRKPTIVAVSGGNIYTGLPATGLAVATTGTGVLSADIERVRLTTLLTKMYFVDGANYVVWDNGTNTASAWAAVSGALPSSGVNTARLIAAYRSRIVLAGVVGDPQNWFMSAAGDPLDWDYGATPTAIMAVAGNNSLAGKCPDTITCLAPLSDDLMVMGGDHTLWIMRGDPADGGRIDNLSQQMGILGPDSFCTDPNGTFYFFGNGVFWRMAQGGMPEPISRGRLDRLFGAIDYSANTVKLLWDETGHGVHIFIVPIAEGTAYHYWWDARTDGFWKDLYPTAHGPTAVLVYDGDSPSDRAVMLGGWDSYIRTVDPAVKSDDGTTILSRVKFGPITPGSVHQNARVNRISTVLGSSSNPVSVRLFAAQSPEEVVAAVTPAWSCMASPVTRYATPRVGGNSVLIELKNDSYSTAWATGTAYAVGAQVVAADGLPYDCIKAHTSTTGGTNPTPPGNVTDWLISAYRSWALEAISVTMEVTGRTRHGRL